MAGIKLEWAQFGDFDNFDVIRSDAPMDINALPSPIATNLLTMYYVDTTVVEGATYYYRVVAWRDGVSKISSEIIVIANAGDVHWDKVVALLHFDGPDGSTTFTDETGKVWAHNGNAQLDTTQSRFGSASLLLDGNGDYITSPTLADFGFGTGDFTVEGYFCRTGSNTNAFLADFRVAGGASFVVWCSQTYNANKLGYSTQGGTNFVSGPALFPVGDWAHWAVSRQAGTVRGFLAGALQFTTTDNRNFASPQGVFIGSSTSVNQGSVGHIDELRITKGVARYTENFTPLDRPFPAR